MEQFCLTALLLLLSSVSLLCQFDTAYYSKFRTGQSLPSTMNFQNQAHLLCFASETSCFICMESLEAMQHWVDRTSCIKMKLFLASSDDSLAMRLKEEHKWKFDVTSDPYGVVNTGFGVVNTPFYYLIDEKAKIISMGPIGSVHSDWENTTNAMKSLCSNRLQSKQIPRLLRDIRVECNAKVFGATLQRQMQTFNRGRSHAVALTASNQIIIIDGDSCVFSGSSKDLTGSRMSYPMVIPSSVVDSSFYLNDIPSDSGDLPYVSVSGQSRKASFDTILSSKYGFRSWLFAAVSPSGRFIATTLADKLRESDNKDSVLTDRVFPTVAIDRIGANADPITFWGASESLYQTYQLDGYYWQCQAYETDSTLLYIQNLSDTLCTLNNILGTVSREPIPFDTTSWLVSWRQKARFRSDTTSTLEFQKGLADYSSTLHNVMYDASLGRKYVTYLNVDHYGSSVEFFVVGPIGSQTCRTTAIPGHAMPHSIYNGQLFTTNVVDGALRIQIFDFAN
jgi:hypothetical protein